jgi:kynurenine formamidase
MATTQTWTLETVLEEGRRLRNWGRWGTEDEAGTLNFITPDKIREAAGLVRQGKIISCSLPYDANGPQILPGRRFNPIRLMLATGSDAATGAQDDRAGIRSSDDLIIMPLQSGTQWDSLAHVFAEGKMYNGRDMTKVNTAHGAEFNGIDKQCNRMATRGVLLDMPRYKGVEWLEPGTPITKADLDGCIAQEGVRVGSGDALLVRTGHITMCKARKNWAGYAGGDSPGLCLETCEWLHDRELAAIVTDTWGMEVRPNETPDCFQPMHLVLIPNMGLMVGEIFDMDELAADCAADGAYEFMFVAPPLPFTGAVGSPLNAYAIK